MTKTLSPKEKKILLHTARQAIMLAVQGKKRPPNPQIDDLPPSLLKPGACFVTLTREGQLRGCVGSILARQPLIQDVTERAVAAALGDPRFQPLTAEELDQVQIEISILTHPTPLNYHNPADLITKLRVGIDGVILKDGSRRATFLPQVWEKLPDPDLFLSRLCLKMGLPGDTWRVKAVEVEVYQVVKFTESEI